MTEEIGFRPHLNPNAPPRMHIDITPCICGAFDGYVPCKDIKFTGTAGSHPVLEAATGVIHMTSVVVTQDEEGWFKVICAECNRTSAMASADMNEAIRLWNEEIADLKRQKLYEASPVSHTE